MRTPRVLVVCLVALALVAAACGSGGGSGASVGAVAATVNGVDIPRSDVEDQLEAIRGNEDLMAIFGLSEEATESVDAQFAALWLTQLIQSEVLVQAAEDQGVEVDESLTEVAQRLAARQFSAPDPATGQVDLAAFDEYPEVFRDATTDQIVGLVALVVPEIGDEVELACARHILISTQPDPLSGEAPDPDAALAEAEQVRAEVAEGADFAAKAEEVSDDPGSAAQGGDLGCLPRGATVEAFDQALFELPVGEVSEVVSTEFGYHIIEVTSREAKPFADYDLDDRETIVNGALNSLDAAEFQKMLEDADVTVDPSYGTWVVDENGARVEPPEAADPPELPEDGTETPAPPEGQPVPEGEPAPEGEVVVPDEAPSTTG